MRRHDAAPGCDASLQGAVASFVVAGDTLARTVAGDPRSLTDRVCCAVSLCQHIGHV
jgi:hypothetical protein